MRIFYDPSGSDPMLLDRVDALHQFADQLRQITVGAKQGAVFHAETGGSPAPYSEFLHGIRISIAAPVEAELSLAHDQWLDLRVSANELEILSRRIERLEDGVHTHLDSAPIALVIEADDTWPGFTSND